MDDEDLVMVIKSWAKSERDGKCSYNNYSLVILMNMWLHLPRAPGVVMTTSVLLGWWILGFYGVGGGAVYIHILGGRHKRA